MRKHSYHSKYIYKKSGIGSSFLTFRKRYGNKKKGAVIKRLIIGVFFIALLILFFQTAVKSISQETIDADSIKKEGTFFVIESALQFFQEKISPSPNTIQLEERIRVVIMQTDFASIYHGEIQLYGTTDINITSGGETVTVQAGNGILLNASSDWWKEDYIHIEPALDGEIALQSIQRARGMPTYAGTMDIYRSGQGLVIVNELPLEQYLYRVVPSEMPESYGGEALKAQAVCARSYAYRQMQGSGYPEFQAHVDDSVSYQVYNNFDSNTASIEAVNQTRGQVCVYDGEVITAYFFSTSCGHTTNWKVWGEESGEKPYLTGKLLSDNKDELDLTQEENFSNFIYNEEINTYEYEEDWYRWTAVLDMQKIGKNWANRLGNIQSIAVEKRGIGGVISCLRVVGEKESMDFCTEYEIRSFLAPAVLEIKKKDGKTITSTKLLPSGYFVISKTDYPTVVLYGGGYGHGAGLSQNGAKNMAKQGKTYEEILKFFYEGVEIQEIQVH